MTGWVATTQRAEDTVEGRTKDVIVVHQLPAKPSERNANKFAGKTNKRLLSALAAVHDGEDTASLQARLDTMQSTWSEFELRYQELEAELDTDCFSEMPMFHPNQVQKQRAMQDPLVPTVVLSTREPNNGDYTSTYQRFSAYLVDTLNAYTVVLQPSHFQHGLGPVILEMLDQLTGDGGAEDMHALFAWYEDQTGYTTEALNQQRQQEAAAQQQLQQQQQAQQQATKTPGNSRSLRQRKAHTPLPGQQQVVGSYRQAYDANRKRPLVVVVQGAEEVGAPALRDLLGALLLDYPRFPATLVLCCSQPARMYLSGLPLSVAGRMCVSAYELPGPEERLERLFSDLLLSGQHPPVTLLAERTLRAALQRYDLQGGGVRALISALHSAHVRHHATQPLAALLAAALGCDLGHVTAAAGGKKVGGKSEESDGEEEDSEEEEEGAGKQVKGKPKGRAAGKGSKAAGKGKGKGAKDEPIELSSDEDEEDEGTNGKTKGPVSLEATLAALPAQHVVALARQLAVAAASDSADGAPGPSGSAPTPSAGASRARSATAAAAAKGVGSSTKGPKPGSRGTKAGAGTGDLAPQTDPESARAAVLESVTQAVDTLALWRLGVRWAALVAEATGAARANREFRPPALYLQASSKRFWTPDAARGRQAAGEKLLGALCGATSQHSVVTLGGSEGSEEELEEVRQKLLEAAHKSQAWRPLPLVATLITQLEQLPQATDVLPVPDSAQAQTQQYSAHPAAAISVDAPSPANTTSVVRRGLENASIISPMSVKPKPKQPVPAPAPAPAAAGAAPQTAVAAAATVAGGKAAPAPKGAQARKAALAAATQVHASQAPQQPKPVLSPGSAAEVLQAKLRGSPEGRLALWLKDALRLLLERSPFYLPGSAVFTYDDARTLEAGCLAPEPRSALHAALVHPSLWLGKGTEDSANAGSTDVEIAYQRLLGQDSALITTWFDDFCEVMAEGVEGDDGEHAAEEDESDGDVSMSDEGSESEEEEEQDVRGRGARGRGKSGAAATGSQKATKSGSKGTVASSRGAAAASKVSKAGSKQASKTGSKRPAQVSAESAGEAQKARLLAWAARFSRAVAELEFMGIVRPSKKRKENGVQKVFLRPETTCLAMYG